MVKGFKQIASFTMLSRVLGVVRDMCYSKYFGATALGDAWLIAFRVPNLSRRIFGEGAASASFIPIYSEMLEKDRKAAAILANTVVTVLFTLLSALVVFGWAAMWAYRLGVNIPPETKTIISLTSIMLPYASLICTVAIIAGILNVHSHFAAPALAPAVLNVFIIGSIVITGSLLGLSTLAQVYVAAVCVMLAGIVQTWLQFAALKKYDIKLRPCWQIHCSAFRKVIILMAPMIIGAAATQLNTLADDMLAWIFSGSETKGTDFVLMGKTIAYPLWRGCVMHLYLAQRLYQLPLGVLGIALATAIFPVLSKAAARKDDTQFASTLMKGINFALYLAAPCALGLCLVAKPLISILFEGKDFTDFDTNATTIILFCYAFGLIGFFFQQILTRALYSLQDSKTPAKTAIVAVLANIVLNLTLIWFMGAAGLALATAICSYLQVVILLIVLKRRFAEELGRSFNIEIVKVLIASAVMFAITYSVLIAIAQLPWSFIYNAIRIITAIIVGSASYLLLSKLMKIQTLNTLLMRNKAE